MLCLKWFGGPLLFPADPEVSEGPQKYSLFNNQAVLAAQTAQEFRDMAAFLNNEKHNKTYQKLGNPRKNYEN